MRKRTRMHQPAAEENVGETSSSAKRIEAASYAIELTLVHSRIRRLDKVYEYTSVSARVWGT
jgi:hypothetical protein